MMPLCNTVLCILILSAVIISNAVRDSKYSWIPMSEDSKRLWYSQQDLCVLERAAKNVSLELTYSQCGLPPPSFPHNFRVGAVQQRVTTNGLVYCVPGYDDRSFFYYEMAGYRAIESSDFLIKNIVNVGRNNGSIIFVGDSVMWGIFDAISGEIARTQHLFPALAIRVHIVHKRWEIEGKGPIEAYLSERIPEDIGTEILLVEFNDGSSVRARGKRNVLFVPIYFYWFSGEDAQWNETQSCIGQLRKHFDRMVIMVNVGLWVRTPVDQIEEMLIGLHALTDRNAASVGGSGARVAVLWRETTAAHFPTKMGYHHFFNFLKCVPLKLRKDKISSVSLNTDLVKSIMKRNRLHNITFVEFFEVTLPLYNMHTTLTSKDFEFSKSKKLDCVHYCYMPTLYQPIWRAHDRVSVVALKTLLEKFSMT